MDSDEPGHIESATRTETRPAAVIEHGLASTSSFERETSSTGGRHDSLTSPPSNPPSTTEADVRKVRFSEQDLLALDKEQLLSAWRQQNVYIDHIERRLAESASNCITRRESDEKLKQQLLESTRRENILVMRLTQKDQETQLLKVRNRSQCW